jgi:hypothetical protein
MPKEEPMARSKRQKELNMLHKLGKCKKCSFLEIKDIEKGKFYCFYKMCNICVDDIFRNEELEWK